MVGESINGGNVFSSLNLTENMLSSLPPSLPPSTPHLRTPHDAIALLSHACMLAVGFRLTGLGSDSTSTLPPSTSETPTSSLPTSWNTPPTTTHTFRYAHTQSSLSYLLTITALGSKALIAGLTLPDEHTVHSLDVSLRDFLSLTSFPLTLSSPLDESASTSELQAAFISIGRITDLASLMKLRLIQKLAPGLQKEGYEESAHAASTVRSRSPPERSRDPEQQPRRGAPPTEPPYAQPRPFDDPLAAGPARRPFPAGDFPPPGFEDEYEINRPPGAGAYGGARRPLNIGERDLYPPGLGPNDPLRMGPGFGAGGGGMHPTFDDPMFGGDGLGEGGWGTDGRAPPGARYDPVGPGDGVPRGGMGGRFPGGRGGGGGMGGPFRGGFGGDII